MQCPSCGTWYAKTRAFCTSCGDILADGSEPAKIGQYRLIEQIGQGGMGIIFKAFDETLERYVAIKVLHQEIIHDHKQLERFRREARLHSQIQHPNVLTLLDLHEEEESLAIIMELLHGCSLKDFIKHRKILATGEIITLFEAILAGLKIAHDQEITHRDLKLSNIFLDDDGSIKLMDFGLAKTQKSNENITDIGATVGSYYYMAPEQILGTNIDARTDLYALGIVLYRVATGQLPFQSTGGGEFEIMEKQVRQAPLAPESIHPEIEPNLSKIIMQLLEKEPDSRPESCQPLWEDIKKLGDATPFSFADIDDANNFSELHANYKSNVPQIAVDQDKSDSAEDDIPHNTLRWAFRSLSPIAPENPPLDLTSPPPIQTEKLQHLRTAIWDIPPLPEIWQKIQALLNAPDTAPLDIAKLIAQDPVLTAHILKICNSAAYIMPGSDPVTDVALALTRLGMDTAHDLILQILVPDFDDNASSDKETRLVWFHAMAISQISRQLLTYGQLVEGHAIGTLGMLHDIGKLVILHAESDEKLTELKDSIASGTSSLKAEWEVLGYTHIDAGMMLALHWRLPRSVHRLMYYHHHPCWHMPDMWPTDVQASIMLLHLSHVTIDSFLEDESLDGIWNPYKRTHLPDTENLLHKPLQIPMNDTSLYSQLKQDFKRIKISFPELFPEG
ncbi:MAG: HDOD domain-containing protein [Mariprofundaceae bacterium]